MVVVMLPLLVARLCRSNFIVILILILRSFYRSHCSKKSKLSSKRERKIRRSPNRLTTNKKRKIQSSGLGFGRGTEERRGRRETEARTVNASTRRKFQTPSRDRSYLYCCAPLPGTYYSTRRRACWCGGGWYYASPPHRDGSHEY